MADSRADCNCGQARRLKRMVRLFALRARYVQLTFAAPHPSDPRAWNRWRRSMRWTEARTMRLLEEIAR